ncbi:cell division control protein 7 [Sporothrix schenckii 1099-18]|uniref:non-specific serine/threonine protein kinase n=1 Tax=Sporothrix schenckii 1099-18 TaxID=1397361 RepID=A0A0F2MFD0_SPOSC|nr:cell division control protein 7 [Sporothrix schenckii 1099-18]KJR87535.1 cell division control protein 7 [Sporothrix schenckii 1099-18]
MATGLRRKRDDEPFKIHEDMAFREDTPMINDVVAHIQSTQDDGDDDDDQPDEHEEDQDDQGYGGENDDDDDAHEEEVVILGEGVEEDDEEDAETAKSEAEEGPDDNNGEDDIDEGGDTSDDDVIDEAVQYDMEKLQATFPSFRNQFRLIKRIGEGTFSTVYKAEDLQYERYDNSWDLDKDAEKWSSPPLKRTRTVGGARRSDRLLDEHDERHLSQDRKPRRRAKYVAIKKIYVTSSPLRILNELELLHDLRSSPSVCPLITAFRSTDQVVAVLPYFRHQDFREYYRHMKVTDMAIYLRSLFEALAAVHRANILHRDIKPTNFLYDPSTGRGVLVDFGLAEREGSDTKPCLCHEVESVRKARIRAAYVPNAAHNGYPKSDTRPSRRANRAGTRGFRAPEVLFKCTEQTTKIDIWSVGVILLTLLSRRFPFFNSADDVEAMIEIATIFGSKRMKIAGQLHGCMFETTIPTVGREGFSLERIILWSNCRIDNSKTLVPLSEDEKLAVKFLNRCLDLDPSSRISAEEALKHEFLSSKMTGRGGHGRHGRDQYADEEEDEMDMI